jgi:hypothetical protein
MPRTPPVRTSRPRRSAASAARLPRGRVEEGALEPTPNSALGEELRLGQKGDLSVGEQRRKELVGEGEVVAGQAHRPAVRDVACPLDPRPEQIAVLLFEGVTALDAVGPFQVLSHLPGAEVLLVGEAVGEVRTEGGHLGLMVDAALQDVPNPDVIVVPGGMGHTAPLADGPTQRWLIKADRTSTWTTSVCTGSLVLGAAGLLRGRRVTTHWLALDRFSSWAAEPRTLCCKEQQGSTQSRSPRRCCCCLSRTL